MLNILIHTLMFSTRMLPCEVFEISAKRLKIDSVSMSKNDIINRDSTKDFLAFSAVVSRCDL